MKKITTYMEISNQQRMPLVGVFHIYAPAEIPCPFFTQFSFSSNWVFPLHLRD